MANNFRKTGKYYVSNGGHDSNDGLTPDTPKKTIASDVNTASSTDVIVIGSGVYNKQSISNNTLMLADGKVVLRGDGTTQYSIGWTNATSNAARNIKGFTIDSMYIYRTNKWLEFEQCVFINCDFSVSTFYGSKDSIYINPTNLILGLSVTNPDIEKREQRRNIIINGDVIVSINIFDSYISFTSTILFTGNNTGFRYNNSQGTITLDSVSYAIQDQFTGTPQDNGYSVGVEWLSEANLTANGYTGTIAGWDAAVATCINRDPRFNDVSKGIFTLKADSPHLGRASDGIRNIGGTDYEDLELVGNLSSSVILVEVSEAIDNTTNTNDWALKAGYEEGYVRIIKKVTDSDYKTLANIPYYGNYSFDSDEIGGTSGNFNVPDSKPQTNNYPTYTATTSDALDVNSIIIAGHGRIAGEWIRVQGQDREISSVDTNTIYFLDAVRAIVLSGTEVKIGSESELAALLPNRLNFELRTSKAALVDASNWNTAATWDNDNLAAAGNYLAQELNNTPMIDNLNGVGFGDDLYDSAFGNKIRAKYVDLKIWIRNNYKS